MADRVINEEITRGLPKPVERWGYDSYFKEYLLLLASKGRVALERTAMFPERIELNSTWHEVMNHMRETTMMDGHEKWAFAGVKAEKRGIFLPTVPIKGDADRVTGQTMNKMKDWARNKAGIVDFVGDIHSHPHRISDITVKKDMAMRSDEHELIEMFSPADFYCLITDDSMQFMGLVAGYVNVFAFKAQESSGLGIRQLFLNQNRFSEHWYQQAKTYGGPSGGNQKMNMEIARNHNLLLYQGRVDKDLVKIFPR